MLITGLVFAGSATANRAKMSAFCRDVLGLEPEQVDGIEADLFALPGGGSFAVASHGGMGDDGRSVGFLVDDLDQAAAELRAAGVSLDDEISSNDKWRYLHFRAPDGQLYELVTPR